MQRVDTTRRLKDASAVVYRSVAESLKLGLQSGEPGMNAPRLNSVAQCVRRFVPALIVASLAGTATGCASSPRQDDLTACLSVFHASRTNAEAIGSLDPDASPTPADRYRGATPDDASLVDVSVSRHPVR
jgi:hypothetical protein